MRPLLDIAIYVARVRIFVCACARSLTLLDNGHARCSLKGVDIISVDDMGGLGWGSELVIWLIKDRDVEV